MVDWYNFNSLYRNATIENVSTTLKAYTGDNGSTLCQIVIVISIGFEAFNNSDLSTKYWLLPKTFVTLTFTTHRNASELKVLHCKERIDISHHLLFIVRGERIAD